MKVIKVSSIIIGSIIGAGFASGKEIFEYFAKYGIFSIIFIILLFIFFSLFINIYLTFGKQTKGLEYVHANKLLWKDRKLFNYNFNLFNIFLFFSFLILSSAMFTALISLMQTYFPYGNKYIYFSIALLITIILLYTSFSKLSSLSNFIVPLIILSLVLNVICSFESGNFSVNFKMSNILPLPFLTLLYTTQNTFFCSVIVTKLGKDLNKKEALLTSIIVAGVISLLILLGILCFLFNPKLSYADMPFAEVAISINPIFSVIFAIILLGSIITTYITSLTSLKEIFFTKKKHTSNALIILLIVLLGLFNFSNIIEFLYPLIGAFGLVYIYKVFSYTKSSFKFSFKKSHKEIHSTGKQTQNNSACQNNI